MQTERGATVRPMRIPYPPELAAHALEGRVLLVWGAAWFRNMVEQGVASLAEHAPPRFADGVSYKAALPEVVLCSSLRELAGFTATGGAFLARKPQCILLGDGGRELEAQLDLLAQRSHEGWSVLLSADAYGAEAQRFAGRANAGVWPFANIQDLGFQASQLKA
jgi:hypothetical protein